MKTVLHILFIGLQIGLMFQTPVPVQDKNWRITNRKYISNILYEKIEDRHFITLILVHPRYHAYKADSHFLHYPCNNTKHCLQTMKKLDEFLYTGYNVGFELNGTMIEKIHYLKPH